MPVNVILLIVGLVVVVYFFFWTILPRFGSETPEMKLDTAKKTKEAAIKDAANEKKEHKKRLKELEEVTSKEKPKRKYTKRKTNVKK